MKEKWKIIEGFPKYLISNKGRIKILSTLEDKKVFVKDDGYIATTLGNGKQNYRYVHRLVADAFVNNKHEKPQVNHINGVKGDNRAENLEWVTHAENIRHAIDTGLLKYKKKEKEIKNSKHSLGEEVNGSKLTPEEVIEIRVLWELREFK
ncbi:MAG TPA: NUMOD4 motif-containing HNH endonuclease [Clostridium perfringens]|nr:NUMOD4 motif-containing HNH endonuclease [Clostridium perfringens]